MFNFVFVVVAVMSADTLENDEIQRFLNGTTGNKDDLNIS